MDQIYDVFFAVYKKKNEKQDQIFREKTDIIRTKLPLSVMGDLEVKEKFRLNNESSDENFMPYNSAVFELNKLSHCKSPREKLDCLTMMNSQMRSTILQSILGVTYIINKYIF